MLNTNSKVIRNHELEEEEQGEFFFDSLTKELNTFRESINIRKRQLMDSSNLETHVDYRLRQYEDMVAKASLRIQELEKVNVKSKKRFFELHEKLGKRSHSNFKN